MDAGIVIQNESNVFLSGDNMNNIIIALEFSYIQLLDRRIILFLISFQSRRSPIYSNTYIVQCVYNIGTLSLTIPVSGILAQDESHKTVEFQTNRKANSFVLQKVSWKLESC